MAKKVSLINMKGGVGKSTITVNLAWHFAAYQEWQKKVLVVDLDPQFNTSQYILGVTQYEELLKKNKPTIWDIFEQNQATPSGQKIKLAPHDPIMSVTKYRGGGKLDLIPSRLELAYSIRNPHQKEKRLNNLLAQLEVEYDLILIDCAPTESVLTTAAYMASDYLLVPVKPEYLSTIGLPLLVNSMQEFKDDNISNLQIAGIVFNSATDYTPEEALSKQTVRQISSKNKWYVFNNGVPFSRSFPKGAREGRPIFNTSYARGSKVSQFNAFAGEFARRIGL